MMVHFPAATGLAATSGHCPPRLSLAAARVDGRFTGIEPSDLAVVLNGLVVLAFEVIAGAAVRLRGRLSQASRRAAWRPPGRRLPHARG